MKKPVILRAFDKKAIYEIKRYGMVWARISLFVIFFWFGFLKVIGLSPANPLVAALLAKTLPMVALDTFLVVFGLFEMIIGILFVIPKLERVVIFFFVVHMIMTALPLVILPDIAWQQPFVPTLEGQYMLKNMALVALGLGIATHLRPMGRKW